MPGAAPPVRQAEAQAAGFDIPAQTSTLHSVSKVCLHTHSYTLLIKSSPWIWNGVPVTLQSGRYKGKKYKVPLA